MASATYATMVSAALDRAASVPRFTVHSRVTRVIGQVVEASSLPVALGELCRIESGDGRRVTAQVVGFHERGVLLMPLRDIEGILPRRDGAAARAHARCRRGRGTASVG